MDGLPGLVKGGLVRRTLALIVDLIVIQVVLQFVAAVAFHLSGGALIDSNSIYTSCEPATERPAGIKVPATFNPTAASFCTKSLIGWPTARLYTLSRTDAGTHVTTTLSYPVGRDNQLRDGFDLAGLQMLALVLMRWGLERPQRCSLGRRLLSLRVVPRWPDATEPSLRAALTRRYALFGVVLLPALLVSLTALAWQKVGAPLSPEGIAVLSFLGNLPATVAALAALGAIIRGRETFYDQAAHTTVARLIDGGLQVAPERKPAEGSGHSVPGGFERWFAVPWATCGIAAILFAVFVGELVASYLTTSVAGVNGVTLLVFGAEDGEVVRQLGQWYRLLNAIFLHANEPHLVANVTVLLMTGWLLEPLIGRTWLIATFLIGGLAASLASVVFNPPVFLSVGASGAVTAIVATGFVISFGLVHGQRRVWLQAVTLACLMAALQASGQFAWGTIDRADHIGGAVAGAIIGCLILALWRRETPRPAMGRPAMITALVVSAALFVSVPFAGFGDVHVASLLIPANQLPQTDQDWVTRSEDLVRHYPRDPRTHLARAIALAAEPLQREQELAALAEAQRQLVPAELPKAQQNAFMIVGLNRLRARDWLTAKDLFTRAIMTTAPSSPEAFANRAESEENLGDFDAALSDMRRQSSLTPTDAAAHIGIADVLFDKEQTGSAIAELDQAVALAPNNGLALRQRGWIEFFNSRDDDALRDLEKAASLMPKDPYAALWLDIVAVRSGHPDLLAAVSPALDKRTWPAPIVRLYAGDMQPEDLMMAAGDPDAVKQEGQRCEASFYYAELLLMQHDDREARPYLDDAARLCPKTFYEWPSARAELSGAAGFHINQPE